jgi:hypothetical protein
MALAHDQHRHGQNIQSLGFDQIDQEILAALAAIENAIVIRNTFRSSRDAVEFAREQPCERGQHGLRIVGGQ